MTVGQWQWVQENVRLLQTGMGAEDWGEEAGRDFSLKYKIARKDQPYYIRARFCDLSTSKSVELIKQTDLWAWPQETGSFPIANKKQDSIQTYS